MTFDKLTIHNVRENIVGVEAKVPLLDGSHRTYVNFDNAASTPALRPVFDKVNEFMTWYSSVHRGTGFKSQISTQVYEQAHHVTCRFVGADPATHVAIFGKNSTEALNKLARRLSLAAGEVVLTTAMEHHSNDLPWRAVAQVEHVHVDENGALDEAHLDHLLDKYAGRVRLVAITGASNVTGYINPIHRIATKAHAAGAQILVDAAQLAPHRAVDMRPDDDPTHIDYLALSAHKMYAPYGTGALIGRRDVFAQGDPDMVGGGTVDIVTLDEVKWAGPPDRDEAGSPNVVGAVALAKTMLCLQEIGMPALAEHEARLTARLLKKLARIEGVQVYGISDPARAADKVGVVPFAVQGMSHYLVAAILSVEGGIGVRNGCLCAHPYILNMLRVPPERAREHQEAIRQGVKQYLPGLVRVSFGCYNTEDEVDWLIEVLERVVRGEYQGHYVQDPASGEFWPQGYAPEIASYFAL
ncbi:MAG: aminotransferase class V-fold PLP-dependent enzyme [Anaerolineae bacterium]|jgi:selenocysteine lyase/cysteine desulfurase